MWCALEDYPKPHVAPLDGGLDVNQQTAQMPLPSLYSLFQRVNIDGSETDWANSWEKSSA